MCVRIYLIMVFFITLGACQTYSLIAIHERATHPAQLQEALEHAYQSHIGSKAGHMVSLWVGTREVLPYTDTSTRTDAIFDALHEHIQQLGVISGGCTERYSFARVLEAIRAHPHYQPTATTYFVVDNAQDSASYAETSRAAKACGAQVYPLGVGRCVQTSDLKRASAPCHPIFGCHPPFAYYQSPTYQGLRQAQSEVQAARTSNKRHAITTDEGLTPVQLAITIILCIIVGVLTLWCLFYSLCYLQRHGETRFRDVYETSKESILIKARVRLF